MDDETNSIRHLSADDILAMHELVVESDSETTEGVSSPGDVEYTIEAIQQGHFGQAPETLHEMAYQLLRLLAANHPFVDGNKRTALMSVRVFYALNGLEFDYDRQIKEILKELATDETAVDAETVVSYFEAHTEPLQPEYQATIALWLERIEANDFQPSSVTLDESGPENDDPNGYDDSHSTEN